MAIAKERACNFLSPSRSHELQLPDVLDPGMTAGALDAGGRDLRLENAHLRAALLVRACDHDGSALSLTGYRHVFLLTCWD